MELQQAKCPSCGGGLKIPDNREKFFCVYCGNEIIVRELTESNKVNVDALLQLATAEFEGGNFSQAINVYNQVLSLDSQNTFAWLGKGLSEYYFYGRGGMMTILDDLFLLWKSNYVKNNSIV